MFLDVNKASIMASNILFYFLKASRMLMHFSDERIVKRETVSITVIKLGLYVPHIRNSLVSFGSCCDQFD